MNATSTICRYLVLQRGRCFWHIVDSYTGRTVGFDRHRDTAICRARAMGGRHA